MWNKRRWKSNSKTSGISKLQEEWDRLKGFGRNGRFMRIALLGDFKHDTLRNILTICRKISKGLTRNGCDVLDFSYRDVMMSNSPIRSKRIARKFTKTSTDRFCRDLLRDYQPDVIIVLSFRILDIQTLRMLREAVPKTLLAGWYEDPLDGITDDSMEIARQLDVFMATGGGARLEQVGRACEIPAAFMPNPCDPDIERRHPVEEKDRCELLFTGTLGHKRCGTDPSRGDLITTLFERYGMTVFGALGKAPVHGMSYFRLICGAKITLSINASNDIRMYHSDRLINYLGCGAFVLAKAVPDSALLFEDRKHLRYFSSKQECLELVDYYLKHDDERNKIAAGGMAHAHTMFHCKRIAGDILDFITTGSYDAPWKEIYSENGGHD